MTKNQITGSPCLKWPGAVLKSALLVTLTATALSLAACRKETTAPDSTPAEAPPPVSATNAAPQKAEFQKLLGRWVRPDGGYILEIKSIDATGQIAAGYFNPNPIKVAKAEAKESAGATKVFIELRDAGYPGCTYNLTFDPTSDSLVGMYFQAAMQQEFSVMFTREK